MPDPSTSSGSPRAFEDPQRRHGTIEGREESRADWTSHIRSRLASLRLSPAREAEIAEELTQHLEDRWREHMARGLTPEQAAHRATTEFNGARLEALLGTLRQAHWHETPPPGPARAFSLDSVLIDLRHAVTLLPARRAASVKPTEALQQE